MSAREETPAPRAPVEVAAAVVVHGARVLVQTRPPGAHYAGWYEFPGGKREDGESLEQCAVRECREELGLDVAVESVLDEVAWSYPQRDVRVTFLLCRPLDVEPAPRGLDGQQISWADAAGLDALRFLPATEVVLDRLRERLGGGDA